MRFALATSARDGSAASLSGSPIFVGIAVGADGLSFEGRLVNVRNSGDNWLLDAFGSETVRSGLSIVTTAQPILKPFVKLATDAVASSAKRRQNMQVSGFDIGLDFSTNATSCKLRLGSYVIVQGEAPDWNWADLRLGRDSGAVHHLDGSPLRSNYLIVGVSEATAAYSPPPDVKADAPARKTKAGSPRGG